MQAVGVAGPNLQIVVDAARPAVATRHPPPCRARIGYVPIRLAFFRMRDSDGHVRLRVNEDEKSLPYRI